MGFNTTVFILNDALHEFRSNPKEFTEGICNAINSSDLTGKVDVSINGYCNYITVMPTQHADIPRLYFTHCNNIIDIGTLPLYRKEKCNFDYLKKCLKQAKKIIKEIEKELKKEEFKKIIK